MDKLSNFAKDRKLRLYLLVHCFSPPWNVPQHQIQLFPKMIMPLNSHRWVKSTAATISASTNPSATTCADHLSQRWLKNLRTLCLQTSSEEGADNGWSFVLRGSSPPHSRSPPPSTTTTRTSSPQLHHHTHDHHHHLQQQQEQVAQVCTTIHRQECRQVPKEHCTTVQVNIDIKIAVTLPSHTWFDNPTVVTGEKVRHHVQTRVSPSQPRGMPSRSFF